MVGVLQEEIRTTLNRAEMIGKEEAKAFRSNTRTLVAWLKNTFPWFKISPTMHILLVHAPDFLDRFESLELYIEQGNEAWYDHYNQNAKQYTASDVQSAANLVRAKALA